ncbi:hypothetical protein [uncultured Alcanivorax sp.]|uniref:hypothetical protein n=1 Tax=uncultured Alcanivorax sp. TaxID=191215 RepID=UPI0032B2E4E6
MRIIAIGIMAALIAACGGLKPGAISVNESLPAMDYNSLTNQYSERHTQIAVQGVVGGEDVLTVYMDSFRPGDSYFRKIMFSRDRILEYTGLIDKYLEWAEMSVSRQDMLDKEIGSAWGQPGMKNRFSIFSASVDRPLLVIKSCTPMGCSDPYPQYYSQDGAKMLKALLVKFGNNDLKMTDPSVYQ